MNLLIHDLDPKKWNEISGSYDDWMVLSADETIKPCVGCFKCWYKTPMECAIKDGYDNIGCLIHQAEEVTVISRYTYGGFSAPVKNLFDRCIGYILPQFEVVKGETHHKKRYPEDKAFTFIFYGHELTREEKESARQYVEAVCANIRGHVEELLFKESSELEAPDPERTPKTVPGKTVLLNCSMRNVKGNTAKFVGKLREQLDGEPEIIDLKDHLNDMTGLVHSLEEAETIVLGMPLYVDGLPAQTIRLFETFRKEYTGGTARIYLLANMGLYESRQLRNLFSAVKQWCDRMGFDYCGGLGISAGELIGGLMNRGSYEKGATKNVAKGISRLAEAVNIGAFTEDIFAEPFMFPRWLYVFIANSNWNKIAKKAGLKPKDLYVRP